MLLVYAVSDKAVLATDIATADGIDFERERGAAARVIVDFCLDFVGVDILYGEF